MYSQTNEVSRQDTRENCSVDRLSSKSSHAKKFRTNNVTSNDEECSGCLLKNLNGIVLQYLENCGLEESYTIFCRECKIRGVPLPQELPEPCFPRTNFKTSDGDHLLNLFDEQEGQELLELWAQFLDDMDPTERDAIKIITFYLHIYVAIIPYRQNKSADEKAHGMTGLREFFQERSTEFAADENMLSLFALPFVAEPMIHPIFKNMFQNPWRDKLRSQIFNVIRHHFQNRNTNFNSSCDLTQMFLNWMKEESESDLEEDNLPPSASKCFLSKANQTEEMFKDDSVNTSSLKVLNHEFGGNANAKKQNAEIETLKKSVLTYEDRYYKLLRVTAEVVGSLEQAVQGKAQDIEELRHRLQQVFPELFPSALKVSEIEGQTVYNAVADSSPNHDTKPMNVESRKNNDDRELGNQIESQNNHDVQTTIKSTKDIPENFDSDSEQYFTQSKTSIHNPNRADECQIIYSSLRDTTDSKTKLASQIPVLMSEHGTSKAKVIIGDHEYSTPPSKARSKHAVMSEKVEEIDLNSRQNHKSTNKYKSSDSFLLEILTSDPTENCQPTVNRKSKTELSQNQQNQQTRSPRTRSRKLKIQPHKDEQQEIIRTLSQSNVDLRKFLKTQPQFAVRNELHPLNNYQQPMSSPDVWKKNHAPIICDPRRTEQIPDSASVSQVLRNRLIESTPRNADKTKSKSESVKVGQYERTSNSNYPLESVLEEISPEKHRQQWAKSPVQNATNESSVQVNLQRRSKSKSKLDAINSVPVLELVQTSPKRPAINSQKKSDKKNLTGNTSNVSFSQGVNEEVSKLDKTKSRGKGGKTKLMSSITPADLERRYQWFSRSDSDVQTYYCNDTY